MTCRHGIEDNLTCGLCEPPKFPRDTRQSHPRHDVGHARVPHGHVRRRILRRIRHPQQPHQVREPMDKHQATTMALIAAATGLEHGATAEQLLDMIRPHLYRELAAELRWESRTTTGREGEFSPAIEAAEWRADLLQRAQRQKEQRETNRTDGTEESVTR